jgi:hypothetical protein
VDGTGKGALLVLVRLPNVKHEAVRQAPLGLCGIDLDYRLLGGCEKLSKARHGHLFLIYVPVLVDLLQ